MKTKTNILLLFRIVQQPSFYLNKTFNVSKINNPIKKEATDYSENFDEIRFCLYMTHLLIYAVTHSWF